MEEKKECYENYQNRPHQMIPSPYPYTKPTPQSPYLLGNKNLPTFRFTPLQLPQFSVSDSDMLGSSVDSPYTTTVHDGLRSSLGFMLGCAFHKLFKRQLRICYGYCNGRFFEELHQAKPKHERLDITSDVISFLEKTMNEMIENYRIELLTISRQEAIHHLRVAQQLDKLGLMKIWRSDPIPIIKMKEFWDFRLVPPETNMKLFKGRYRLQAYHGGVLMRFLPINSSIINPPPNEICTPEMPNFFNVLRATDKWQRSVEVTNVAELNRAVFSKEIQELLWVSEALHEKRCAHIVDAIIKEFPKKRIICISGPSSSGKTTIAKRLIIQLRVATYRGLHIGMDDFYRPPEECPRNKNGLVDYEQLDALDIDLLTLRVTDLLNGKNVPERRYNFTLRKGHDNPKKMMSIGDKTLLIIEGIHALNPQFTKKIGPCHRIFVSAITTLNLDNSHHMSTADNRVFRRMLRDYRTRGYSATETLLRWPLVRAGEHLHIFPHQEEADHVFNTSLIYEMPLLANYCKPLLAEVTDPKVQDEASRLLTLLDFFYPMTDEFVPGNSVLREFCGHSAFHY